MKKFLTGFALAITILLSACGTTHVTPNVPSAPQVQITDSQFDCGPRAPALPSDQELQSMPSRELLDLYYQAWSWGARCDGLLQQNHHYFQESLRDRGSNPPPTPPVAH